MNVETESRELGLHGSLDIAVVHQIEVLSGSKGVLELEKPRMLAGMCQVKRHMASNQD